MAERFASASRDEWARLFAGTDACVFPVLSLVEAREDPHNNARGVFTELSGYIQPATAPRFAQAAAEEPGMVGVSGAHTRQVLASLEYPESDIARLLADGVVMAG